MLQRSVLISALCALMLGSFAGCQRKQPAVIMAAFPVPGRACEAIEVKPSGTNESMQVGVVYPLESSAEEIMEKIDLAAELASKQRRRGCCNAILFATYGKT